MQTTFCNDDRRNLETKKCTIDLLARHQKGKYINMKTSYQITTLLLKQSGQLPFPGL